MKGNDRPSSFSLTSVPRYLAFLLHIAAFVTVMPFAQATETPLISVDIPSQPLVKALEQLKYETGMSLKFQSGLVADKTSAALKGKMPSLQILEELLAGTGVTYRSENGIVVLHAYAAEGTASGKEQSITLPELMIKQTRETSYITEQSSTATRIPAPVQDVPRSIGVVTRNVIEDQKAFRIDETVRNVSGTFMSSTQGGRAGEFIIRGFSSTLNVFKNGFREDSTYGACASRDTANIESIEVVKGPPSYLYGRSDPGGVINQITKAPLGYRYFSGEMIFGSYGFISPDHRYWRATERIGQHHFPVECGL